jgi:hypothetical protein
MTDLVKRLRSAKEASDPWDAWYLVIKAADRIEQLEEALRQISNDGNWDSAGCWEGTSYPDEIALAALGEKKDG